MMTNIFILIVSAAAFGWLLNSADRKISKGDTKKGTEMIILAIIIIIIGMTPIILGDT